MKRSLGLLSVLIFILLVSGSCRKNRSGDPLSQLPPETQTGANTFGCLVDGQVFTPKGNPLSGPVIKAYYQFVNGIQTFGISARHSDGTSSKLLGIGGDSILITVKNYDLASVGAGQLSAGYTYRDLNSLSGVKYGTTEKYIGQLKITNFNMVNQIVSGTFWYDAIDSTTGKIVQVREGRFDLPYVK